MENNTMEFENKMVSERIQRFPLLLNHSDLDFKQYQYDGVEWCLHSELREFKDKDINIDISNVRGGLIVDEMGLGKTIMMIGTMFCNMVPRTLIVLPPVLIHQWYKEIFRVSGHKALIYYGQSKRKVGLEDLLKARIVLTSYNHIAISRKVMRLGLLHRILWDRVVFDEAHHLRNKNTIRFLGCKNIRARIRWFISGTPIQNKKEDFYHLCDALGMNETFYKKEENLLLIRSLFILNRKKKDVGVNIELKDIDMNIIIVPWKSVEEKKVAQEIHSLISVSNNTGKGGEFSDSLMERGKLIAFLRAKQSCITPLLMKNLVNDLVSSGEISNEYLEYLECGSKMNAVISTIMSRSNNENGKIVFCHFHTEIDYLARILKEKGLKVMVFDGRIQGKNRVIALSTKFDVLILQIQSGSEGLNLQEHYSEVYFISPHWNPSIEDQAIARCHRIGQLKKVSVFRFIMDDFNKKANEDEYDDENDEKNEITLENYIYQVQEAKRVVRKNILGN